MTMVHGRPARKANEGPGTNKFAALLIPPFVIEQNRYIDKWRRSPAQRQISKRLPVGEYRSRYSDLVEPHPIGSSNVACPLRVGDAEMSRLPAQVWSIENVRITSDEHWWGYVLHLNEDATQLLADIDEFAGKLAGAPPGELKPIGDLIKYYLMIRNDIIKSEDRGQGVKLVSPWTMPTLLAPLPEHQHFDDSQLRWTAHDPIQGSWVDEQKLNKVYSEGGPALAAFQDKLYCIARGAGNDTHLWWMTFDGQWSDYNELYYSYSDDDPSLAVHNEELYCAFKGTDNMLWWMKWQGGGWTQNQRVDTAFTLSGPGLVSFHGNLYCVTRGSDDSLWWMTSDGYYWSQNQRIQGAYTAAAPALAVYNDKLYCVSTGRDSSLWWTAHDGYSWTPHRQIFHTFAYDGPSLAVFDGRLYCAVRGTNENFWWNYFDGWNWSVHTQVEGVRSARRPGLVVYRHPAGTRDQILCVHRGVEF